MIIIVILRVSPLLGGSEVPRSLVLEVPLAPTTPTVPTLRPSPLAGALPTGGRWYDVLGDGAGRAAARRLAERLLEEEEKGSKVRTWRPVSLRVKLCHVSHCQFATPPTYTITHCDH